MSPLERLLAAFQLFLRSPATLLFYPSPPLPPPITTVLTLLSFQTPTNLWLYAAARTADRVGRELRGEVAQWELCGMKQRRHPIKNQSEACASVTLQKGLWRCARSLNAGLSSELDVTWHVVFLQHFFLVLLNLNVVFPCWSGDRQQNSSVGFVDAILASPHRVRRLEGRHEGAAVPTSNG